MRGSGLNQDSFQETSLGPLKCVAKPRNRFTSSVKPKLVAAPGQKTRCGYNANRPSARLLM